MSAILTPWFPKNVVPVRPGVYQVQHGAGYFFAYWNGKDFGWRDRDSVGAYERRFAATAAERLAPWRGLAFDPNEAPK